MKSMQFLWILIIKIKKISFLTIFITVFYKIFLQLRSIPINSLSIAIYLNYSHSNRSCRFGYIYRKNPWWKISFFCNVARILLRSLSLLTSATQFVQAWIEDIFVSRNFHKLLCELSIDFMKAVKSFPKKVLKH